MSAAAAGRAGSGKSLGIPPARDTAGAVPPARLTDPPPAPIFRAFPDPRPAQGPDRWMRAMKVVNSLKTAKRREKNCRIVRRKGRVYVINKKNPRFKARQG